MRIVLDLSKLQKDWFEISDFTETVISIINDIKRNYNKDIDLFCFLHNDDDIGECINGLTEYIARDRIKTMCFYPKYDEESENDISIKKCFEKWFVGQFKADLVIIADYDYNLHKNLNKLGSYKIENSMTIDELIEKIKLLTYSKIKSYCIELARSIEDSRLFLTERNIFVSVSGNIVNQSISGIPRVVNGFTTGMQSLLSNKDTKCYPIYSLINQDVFYYARVRKQKYYKQKKEFIDNVVQFHDGDILFMPDLILDYTYKKKDYFLSLLNRGIRVVTYLHDIFPIYYPEQYAEENISKIYTRYLETISKFSAVIANSKTTLENYLCWCKDCSIKLPNSFFSDYVYLGADIRNALGTEGLPNDHECILNSMRQRTTLMMVGLINQRKNHELVLDAMELLWANSCDINLVFVGNYGWKMEGFVQRIETHEEMNNRFFWIRKSSDEYLDLLYRNTDGIIYISVDEGYGLPIIEASFYDKPLLLRNIDIFHEIAGENATYYNGSKDPFILANTIKEWVNKINKGTVINSKGIKHYTWKESSKKLIDILLKVS